MIEPTVDRPRRPEPLSAGHDLTSFSCGEPSLDDWLRLRARKAEGQTARTYVSCIGERVVGYYCLATGSVTRAAMSGTLRRNVPDPVPVMVIGRLAVDATVHGRGLGSGLLKDALQRIVAAAAIVGTRAVLIHAFDDHAAGFYRRYGFVAFPPADRTLFLPVETIANAIL